MKILMASYAFPPSIGGVETVADILSREFSARGHELKVITETAATEPDRFPFEVIRQPTPSALLRAARWCDVYYVHGISLRLSWPLLLIRRPWVVSIHEPLFGARGRAAFMLMLKRIALRFAHVISCNRATAEQLGRGAVFVPNPYRAELFRCLDGRPRPYDLVFLGRLVSIKGTDVLVRALALLRERGVRFRLLIIGSGPEEAALRAQCASLGLSEQVEFAGALQGEELARRLNQCRIMVIPSVWQEPFPLVPLEGIACGCVVVASHVGGLPEGVGPCGVTFPMSDTDALADRLAELGQSEQKMRTLQAGAEQHLARHRPQTAADAYLEIIERAARKRSASVC